MAIYPILNVSIYLIYSTKFYMLNSRSANFNTRIKCWIDLVYFKTLGILALVIFCPDTYSKLSIAKYIYLPINLVILTMAIDSNK